MSSEPIKVAVIRCHEDVVAASLNAPDAIHLPAGDPSAFLAALPGIAQLAENEGRPLRVLGRSRFDPRWVAEIEGYEGRIGAHPARALPASRFAEYPETCPGVCLAGLGVGMWDGELHLDDGERRIADAIGVTEAARAQAEANEARAAAEAEAAEEAHRADEEHRRAMLAPLLEALGQPWSPRLRWTRYIGHLDLRGVEAARFAARRDRPKGQGDGAFFGWRLSMWDGDAGPFSGSTVIRQYTHAEIPEHITDPGEAARRAAAVDGPRIATVVTLPGGAA